VVSATSAVRVPDELPFDVAALFGCAVLTGVGAAVNAAGIRPGDRVVVFGLGGVGLAALLGARVAGAGSLVAVDVVPEKLAHATSLGAEAAIDARDGDTAARIRELTGGGAHVSVEALGIAQTTNASIECLRPLGRHVQVGMPVGHTARMEINMNAVYVNNLALYGTRGMPPWRYPSLLALIEHGDVDFAPLIAREVALGDASAELRAFNGPTPPGVAVITDFAH
jgi:alcohol dehydrogenase